MLAGQSAVGTYSYVIGPMIQDRIRSQELDSSTIVLGNAMDQNANGNSGEDDDFFASPMPLNGVPFQLPYNQNTEPLIIPGPHVIYTYTQYATPPTAAQVDGIENGTIPQTDNVVVNNTVSAIFVLFDRDMSAASFVYPNASNPNMPNPVLSLMGPDGRRFPDSSRSLPTPRGRIRRWRGGRLKSSSSSSRTRRASRTC